MALRVLRRPLAPSLQVPSTRGFERICKLPWFGNPSSKIMFVVDPIVYDEDRDESCPQPGVRPLNSRFMNGLAPFMKSAGISSKDICIVAAAQPVTKEVWDRDKQLGEHIKASHDDFMAAYNLMKPKMIIASGRAAARQVYNRAVKITKIRGIAEFETNLKTIVLPTLGIAQIMRVPEHSETLQADLLTASRIINDGFSLDKENTVENLDYRWCTDLKFLLDNPPERIGLDTESSSYGQTDFPHWYEPSTRLMTVQISDAEGRAYVVPIDYPQDYPGRVKNPKAFVQWRQKIVHQLKRLLENPNVKKVGQNLKHDYLQLKAKLGITMQGYEDDTLMLVHMLNENMQSKALDEIARVHIPKMSGYKDAFRRMYERKVATSEDDESDNDFEASISRMDLVKPKDILAYSAADADVVLRLYHILTALLKKDPKNYNCSRRVGKPALNGLCAV